MKRQARQTASKDHFPFFSSHMATDDRKQRQNTRSSRHVRREGKVKDNVKKKMELNKKSAPKEEQVFYRGSFI